MVVRYVSERTDLRLTSSAATGRSVKQQIIQRRVGVQPHQRQIETLRVEQQRRRLCDHSLIWQPERGFSSNERTAAP